MADKSLQDMVAALIADAKSSKKPKRKAARKGGSPASPPPDPKRFVRGEAVPDPWRKASVVLIVTYTHCESCGHEARSWEPHLYLETFTRGRNPCRHIERIESYGGRWTEIYGSLPKRMEPRLVTTETCPQCFGLADNGSTGPLYVSVGPQQPDFFHNAEVDT